MSKKKPKAAADFRGQLMLQISAGRYFGPDTQVAEKVHRRTVYSNVWLWNDHEIELSPIGRLVPVTADADFFGHILEAVDRLERLENSDGPAMGILATGGDELVDDLAYVLSFAMNRTFSRDLDLIRKVIPHFGASGRRRQAAGLFPHLFEPRTPLQASDFERAEAFLARLLELGRDDFAKVMRVIRNSLDATRRALDDPTGAYTDLVAALESLAEDAVTTSTTWNRLDGRKRKILDEALAGQTDELVVRIRNAILEADRVGLKRRFVSSTLARISPEYYRSEAAFALAPPRSADVERMLEIAYDIRSRKSHVLEDLGEEAWGFSDGAETAHEPKLKRVYTLAGLWRLIRHVVGQYIEHASKMSPEPWNYHDSLPNLRFMLLAPQYWVGQNLALDHKPIEAFRRLEAVIEALVAWRSGALESFGLGDVPEQIEQFVPSMARGDHQTVLVAIHRLWHEWSDPNEHRQEQSSFAREYETLLEDPSPAAFAVQLLARDFEPRNWTPQEWADLATSRRASRVEGRGPLLPAKVDALLQVFAADRMNTAGRRAEALVFASNAVEECPGDDRLIAFESTVVADDEELAFDLSDFLFGRSEDAPDHDPESGPG